MAYVNGNKPIVTNGLVYALDFGNTKSYTSGSNTARSMVFDPTGTTAVTGSTAIPTLTNGVLNFTGSQFVRRTGSLSVFDSQGSFTVQIVGKANTPGNLFSINTTSGNLASNVTPSSSLFGFNLSSGDFSRTYRGFTSSSLQHVTYRYSQGSIDIFLNGIPVTASQANTALTTTAISNALFINSGSNFFSGSVAQFYVYNRALSADEIYENYLVSAGRNSLPAIPKPYTQDENVYKFLQTTGITDSNTVSAISTFVSGLKSAGLWNKMTAIYPFLSTSTGSQTVNLKDPGVLGLGLTGSFSASAAGLTPASSTAYVDTLPSNIPYPSIDSASAHLSLLSYDIPQGNGFLAGNSAPAIGGDFIVSSGSRIYHVYRNVGTSSFYMTNPSITNVEVLVVAGGGAGGKTNSAGGGAGGLVYSSSFSITPGAAIQVVVGDGGTSSILVGTGVQNQIQGQNGQNSLFGTIITTGGGGGAAGALGITLSGGSGGGGSGPGNISGSGISGQGFDGGGGAGISFAGGGGGGSNQKGQDANTTGAGGSGSYFSQFAGLNLGSPAGWFAGGGGGSYAQATSNISPGGPGGGGSGGRSVIVNINAISNTGGGGGAQGDPFASIGRAGFGGSGIVIVSYNLPSSALTGSGTGFYLTDSAITASVNNQFTAGITGSGNIGFLTVSRTGSNTFSIHKNNISQSVASASLGALPTDVFFNTANLAGSGSLPLPATLAYASIGAGLTTTEVATYYNLVSQFQTNLKRQNTLLDNFSGAAAAYSLRRIGPSGYFGPAIRVRRDSDNTLRDIGFTSDGQLDTVGLLDFVGVTGSGFVQTWYDQSGNGKNATQTTAGSQPSILTSGSIILNQYNKPTLRSDGDDGLDIPTGTFTGENVYTYAFIDSIDRTSAPTTIGSAHNQNPAYIARIRANDAWTTLRDNAGNSVEFFASRPANFIGVFNMFASSSLGGSRFSTYDNLRSYATGVIPNYAGRNFSGMSQLKMFNGVYYFGVLRMNEVLAYPSDPGSDTVITRMLENQAVTGSDPDYQSFITATGITEPTQSAALETLVSDLKSYGLWNKMKAIYPMITDKNNRLSDSQTLTNNWFQISSSLTVSSSAAPDGSNTGFLFKETATPTGSFTVVNNGASAYTFSGDTTGDNPTLTLQRGVTYSFYLNASGHPFYIMTGSGAYSVDGRYDTGVTGQGTEIGTLTFTVPSNAPDTLAYVCQVHSSMGGTINIINNTAQHYITRTVVDDVISGSEYVVSFHGRYLNRPWMAVKTDAGVQGWFNVQTGTTGSFTGSRATVTAVSGGWYRCALYFTASEATAPRAAQFHLTDADNSLSYAGNTASGSYIWGVQWENGNLLGPYRVTSNGFTTGSMLDQMKYNLKNPVDTDAGFRLIYSGTPSIGFAGINISGSRIDTNYYPSRSGSLNNEHITLYKSKDGGTTRPNQADIQGYNSTILNGLYTNYYGTILYENGNSSNGTYAAGITNPGNNVGMYAGTRINNQISIYKNQSKLIQTQVSASSAALTTGNLKFGVYTDSISGHNRVYSFSTIGDGLTDYEAKALYWIVQKYQTTLGRQVY